MKRYRKVSAAEAYRRSGLRRPVCHCDDCAGELLMYWQSDARRPAGGFYRCASRERARALARYHADPERRRAQARAWQAANRERTNGLRRARLAVRTPEQVEHDRERANARWRRWYYRTREATA